MTPETDNGAVEWALALKDVNGKLAPLLVIDGSEMPAQDLTCSNRVLKFLAPCEGQNTTSS